MKMRANSQVNSHTLATRVHTGARTDDRSIEDIQFHRFSPRICAPQIVLKFRAEQIKTTAENNGELQRQSMREKQSERRRKV